MAQLTREQLHQAIAVMREYLNAPKATDGLTLPEHERRFDEQRVNVIEAELQPLVRGYLADKVDLRKFKSRIDGINKQNELWGFKGAKGQMFFNILVNTAGEVLTECDQELKAAIVAPENETMAASRIRNFASYAKRLGQDHVEAGGRPQGRPNPSSVPFFLSYFWHIQHRDVWPVYYTNSVNVMNDLNLWQASGDPAADYLEFKQIHEQLAVAFSKASNLHFGLYEVEHVFWFKGGNPYLAKPPGKLGDEPEEAKRVTLAEGKLPDSYVPPVIAILPRLARNEDELQKLAGASGITLDRAFEKSLYAAFTVLGYETELLGPGHGRVPDGQALDADDSYALLWDAKARTDGYSLGTDDRAIKEYIVTRSRELKKRKSLRNIYYAIISSRFADDYDSSLRMIKMETDVNEVCLIEAEAVVAMVDAKLRAPRELSLGPDGLQRLFSSSGIITAREVREILG